MAGNGGALYTGSGPNSDIANPFPNHQAGNTNQGEGVARDKKKNKKKHHHHGGNGGNGGNPVHHHHVANALDTELNAAVNLKYGNTLQGLNNTGAALGGWFDEYRAALAKARSDTASLYSVGPGAPAGGTPIPQVTDPTNLDQQAAANRASLANAFAGLMHDQGANQTSMYDQLGANTKLQETGEHVKLNKERRGLKREIGSFKTDWLRQRAQDDRQYNLESKALGVKQDALDFQQTKLDTSINKEKNAVITSGPFAGFTHQQVRNLDDATKAGFRKAAGKNGKGQDRLITSGAFSGYTQGEVKKMKHGQRQQLVDSYNNLTHPGKYHGGKDRFGNTRVQRRSNNNSWESALDYLRLPGVLKTKGLNAGLVAGQAHVPHDVAEAALYWGQHGAHLTPEMKRRLRKLGIKFQDDGYKGIG